MCASLTCEISSSRSWLITTRSGSPSYGCPKPGVCDVREAPVAALPAVCRLPGDSTAADVVPVAGTVVRVLAQDGQAVTQGQPLLQLSSRDFLAVQAGRRTVDAQVRVLGAHVERDRALVAEGIASARRLQEGEAELRAAQARAASSGALLASMKSATNAPSEYLLMASAADASWPLAAASIRTLAASCSAQNSRRVPVSGPASRQNSRCLRRSRPERSSSRPRRSHGWRARIRSSVRRSVEVDAHEMWAPAHEDHDH